MAFTSNALACYDPIVDFSNLTLASTSVTGISLLLSQHLFILHSMTFGSLKHRLTALRNMGKSDSSLETLDGIGQKQDQKCVFFVFQVNKALFLTLSLLLCPLGTLEGVKKIISCLLFLDDFGETSQSWRGVWKSSQKQKKNNKVKKKKQILTFRESNSFYLLRKP